MDCLIFTFMLQKAVWKGKIVEDIEKKIEALV
jgi:hypothetical protein